MILQSLTFSDKLNFSLQVGDQILYVDANSNIIEFGVVTKLLPNGDNVSQPPTPPNSIVVSYDPNTVSPPSVNDYIMFSKNKEVNTSSLKGYFAEVEFVNNSTSDITLFSISAEVSESSK
tara:strand:+ start:558 stop:917 length:360 start_codon:yes stop_codon:yes gene_type:complete